MLSEVSVRLMCVKLIVEVAFVEYQEEQEKKFWNSVEYLVRGSPEKEGETFWR